MEISGSLWSSKTPLKLEWKNVKCAGLQGEEEGN